MKDCHKQLRYNQKVVVCGYAFPAEPACEYRDKGAELIRLTRNGEKTQHHRCLK